jgi:hypothetical protein
MQGRRVVLAVVDRTFLCKARAEHKIMKKRRIVYMQKGNGESKAPPEERPNA